MKKFIITAALFAASITTAQADCGTNQLNGTWRLANIGGGGGSLDYTILNGVFAGVAPISQNSNCKVTLVIGGTTYKGRTENLKDTDRKPLTMMFSEDVAGADIIVLFKR